MDNLLKALHVQQFCTLHIATLATIRRLEIIVDQFIKAHKIFFQN